MSMRFTLCIDRTARVPNEGDVLTLVQAGEAVALVHLAHGINGTVVLKCSALGAGLHLQTRADVLDGARDDAVRNASAGAAQKVLGPGQTLVRPVGPLKRGLELLHGGKLNRDAQTDAGQRRQRALRRVQLK